MTTVEQENSTTAANAADSNLNESGEQVELGMEHFHAQRFDEALAGFQRAISLDPNAARAYNGIGRVHYHIGPPEAAIEAYERAIALDRKYSDPYFGLGILYSAQLGKYAAAIEAFQRGLEHDPEDGFLLAMLGSTYARMARFDEALDSLQQTISRQPENAFAYGWLSIVYLYLKRMDDVIASCQREIEIEDDHSARRLLGYAHDWLGQHDEAIAHLDRAIALEPADYEARGALARVYRMAGREQDANEQHAIASEMASRENEYGQACFESVSGNTEQALALLEVALAEGQLQPGWARIDPEFTFINDDPRFTALIGEQDQMVHEPQTWHYGIVAQHWAEFENYSLDAPDVAWYQQFIERDGQPALDVACGTGRLLLPYLRAGLDVDGCDISSDMLSHCREKTADEGFSPNLYAQAMHELDLPRRYRTIFVCGSFGIGGTRQQDALALRRFHEHLAPGGLLLLDQQMPYGDGGSWYWKDWLKENREQLDPEFWTEGERERASDGREFVLRSRMADIDPLEQRITLQMRAELWQDEQLAGEEVRTLTSNVYFKNELVMMLNQAGFDEVIVRGDFSAAEATRDHSVLVFIARKEA